MPDAYTHGHHESVLRSHRWRTAENSAGYLLPHLRPGLSVLDVGSAKTGGRSVLAGIAICFDIVDDELLRQMTREGAQVVFAQTNNADFGFTDESVQQLAIARIRAMETGRSVVNISTVGTSAIIYPDGSEYDRLPWYTPGVMIDDVPLGTTMTPAVVGGRQIEWLVSFGALIVLVLAGVEVRRSRRRSSRGDYADFLPV